MLPAWVEGPNPEPTMKNSRIALLALLATTVGSLPLAGQETPPAPPAPPAGEITAAPDPAQAPPKKSMEEIKKLVAPYALYPDAILAPVLTASTMSPDIVQARRYLDSGKSAANLEAQPWDKSVKTLVRYPAVLKKLDGDLERTNQLGEAFLYQQAEVLAAVQELREAAYAKGNLKTNPKTRVVREDSYIRIEPVDADFIYIPEYDPAIVYYRDYDAGFPFIRYGAPLALGAWLYYGFDWRDRYVGYYPSYWRPGVGYAAGSAFVAGRPSAGFARWSPNTARPGVYLQRNAAALRAAQAARAVQPAPGAGFAPGAGRPELANPALARPGAPGAVGLAPTTREGRLAAAREARAARVQAANEARAAKLQASRDARAARVQAARDARAARGAALANPNSRGARAAAVREARAAGVRGSIANPNARGARAAAVREARVARGPKIGGPRGGGAPKFAAPKAAPAAKGKKPKP